MRTTVPVAALLLALTIPSARSLACSCGQRTTAQHFEAASVVFDGYPTVVRLDQHPAGEGQGLAGKVISRTVIEFHVNKWWKGGNAAKVVVTTGMGGGDCGTDFRVGERYVVFAGGGRDGLYTSICSGNLLLNTAGGTIQELDRLAASTEHELTGSPRGHPVDCAPLPECGDPSRFGDTFDWQHRDPLEFLEVLQEIAEKAHASGVVPQYVVHGFHRGWIRDADVRGLMELMDSSMPCAVVVSSLSSVLPSEASTVGREAMFLIEGYRKGGYPPAISSAHCECIPAEIRRWRASGAIAPRSTSSKKIVTIP